MSGGERRALPDPPDDEAGSRGEDDPSPRVAIASWLLGFAILCGFELLGELVSAATHVPLPGSIVGMLLLLAALFARVPRLERLVRPVGDSLIALMPLFLVPLAAGLVEHVDELASQWLVFLVTVLVGWLACALAAVAGFVALSRGGRGVRRARRGP